eukprot:380632-Pleurochrysis_carterae.AAC.1
MVRELERVELELRRREHAELLSLRAQLALALRGGSNANAATGNIADSLPAPAPVAPVGAPPGCQPHASHSRRLELCAVFSV